MLYYCYNYYFPLLYYVIYVVIIRMKNDSHEYILAHTIFRYDPFLYKIYVNLYIKILLDIRNLPYQLTIYLYLNEIRIRRIRYYKRWKETGKGWVAFNIVFTQTYYTGIQSFCVVFFTLTLLYVYIQ